MAFLMDYLTCAAQQGASDLFIVPGAPVSIKREGQLLPIGEEKVMPALGEKLIGGITLRYGGVQLDDSIRHRLDELHRSLSHTIV